MYPGWHLLGSRDWVSDDRPLWNDPPLGEWSGATKWYRGDPPAVLPLPVRTGDEDCIQRGERAGLAIQINKSARCVDMLPLACYLESELLRQKTNIDNCVWAVECLRIIALAYSDLPAAEARVLAFFDNEVDVVSTPSLSQLFPAFVVAVKGDLCMVWITGTTNLFQGAVQALYFGSGPISQGDYTTSQIYEAAALLVMSALSGNPLVPTCTRFILSGHSYGAAVAYVVAAKLRVANADREVEVLTFGMPNPGGETLIRLLDASPQRHYVNLNDPIPFLPPSGFDLTVNYGAIGALLALQWTRYRRPSHVTIITDDGTLDMRASSEIDNSQITTLVLLIAAAADIEPFTDHDTSKYLQRLTNACPCVPKPANRYKVTMTNLLCTIISESELVPEIIFYCEYDPDEEKWFHPYDGQKGAVIGVDDDYPTVPNAFEFNYSSDTLLLITSGTFTLPDDWFLGCEIGNDSLIPFSEFRYGSVESIRFEAAELV